MRPCADVFASFHSSGRSTVSRQSTFTAFSMPQRVKDRDKDNVGERMREKDGKTKNKDRTTCQTCCCIRVGR